MERTIEERSADILLDKPRVIKIGQLYISQPVITLTTIIATSEMLCGTLEPIKLKHATKDATTLFTLLNGQSYKKQAAFLAILALGYYTGKYNTWRQRREMKKLRLYIENKIPAYQYESIYKQLVEGQRVEDFFEYTTSLSEINILMAK